MFLRNFQESGKSRLWRWSSHKRSFFTTAVHEVPHEWGRGVVGTDRIQELRCSPTLPLLPLFLGRAPAEAEPSKTVTFAIRQLVHGVMHEEHYGHTVAACEGGGPVLLEAVENDGLSSADSNVLAGSGTEVPTFEVT